MHVIYSANKQVLKETIDDYFAVQMIVFDSREMTNKDIPKYVKSQQKWLPT